jgi:hypothetical protein
MTCRLLATTGGCQSPHSDLDRGHRRIFSGAASNIGQREHAYRRCERRQTVDRTDVTLTKGQVGLPVTGSNFREDVNVNGTITSGHLKVVKGDQGHSLP